MSEITQMLDAVAQGKKQPSEDLLPLVYEELRRLAAVRMAREAAGQTLQPTALVHEAWLSLVDSKHRSWQNRAHFFGAAAEAMRRILIDRVRRKQAERRGAGARYVDVDSLEIASPTSDDQLLAVNEALDRFAAREPQKAELVKLRYFVGFSLEETAAAMGLAPRTAGRLWTFARAWLRRELEGKPAEPDC